MFQFTCIYFIEHPEPASVNQLSSSALNATASRCGDTRMSITSDTHNPHHYIQYSRGEIPIFISAGTTLGWTPP